MTYATTEDVKTHLSLPDDDLDEIIDRCVDAAVEAVTSYCDRVFTVPTSTDTRTYYACDRDLLAVDDIANTTSLAVDVDSNDDGTYDESWTVADDILARPDTRRAGWPYTELLAVGSRRFPVTGRRPRVQVTAQFGWSAVPDGVTYATTMLAAKLVNRRLTPDGIAGFAEFAVRVTRDDPDIRELLRPYERRPIKV